MGIKTPPPRHDHRPLKFPKNFLWGAATSAYQVEGNNTNTDWWQMEQSFPKIMRSGLAADQYHLYEKDFDLAKKYQHNAHRLSIEWSRIQPKEDEFDLYQIEHYRQVLTSLKNRGIKVMLTLHHFTNPLWFAKKGGWTNSSSPFLFDQFVQRVVFEFKDLVDFWITINEPTLLVGQSYINKIFPPKKKNYYLALKAFWNLAQAHKKAYQTIHQIDTAAKVGFANTVISFRTLQAHSLLQHLLVDLYDTFANHSFYILTGLKTHDFLGVNYYFHQRIGSHNGSKWPKIFDVSLTKKEVSDLGWELHPEGIFDILEDLSEYKKPIYITENGLASTNDDRRCRFLISYLSEVYHALAAGVDIRGYFHWSLIDNFEWEHGFTPRFGLIEIDYSTLRRIPRSSLSVYANIIEENAISHDLLMFVGHSIHADDVLHRHLRRKRHLAKRLRKLLVR